MRRAPLSDKLAKQAVNIACALLGALAAGAHAQEDPLKSAACGAALAELQQARGAGGGNVEALRSAAALACLGTAAPAARPSRVLQAPVVVPPPQIDVPRHAAPLPSPALPPPPVAIERPPSPALCDAAGCWASDGSHLRHVPATPIAPPGGCIAQGPQVFCP